MGAVGGASGLGRRAGRHFRCWSCEHLHKGKVCSSACGRLCQGPFDAADWVIIRTLSGVQVASKKFWVSDKQWRWLRHDVCEVTGPLGWMTRAEAFEVVRSHGGTPSQTVTRQLLAS